MCPALTPFRSAVPAAVEPPGLPGVTTQLLIDEQLPAARVATGTSLRRFLSPLRRSSSARGSRLHRTVVDLHLREPDQTGTTLSLAFEWSTKVPLVDKAVDRVAWNGDRDLDTMLAHFKEAIEA
jgi:hypothetical protein